MSLSKNTIVEINHEIIKSWNKEFPAKAESFGVNEDRLTEVLQLVNQNEEPLVQAIFLMVGISWAQPFSGANKRTAYICADTLLKMNRYRMVINSKKEKDYLIGLLNEVQVNRVELDSTILIKISIYVMKRTKRI